MQRLRNSELMAADATTDDQTDGVLDSSPEGESPQTDLESVPTVSVTVENRPADDPEEEDKTGNEGEENPDGQTRRIGLIPVTPSVGISPSATAEPVNPETPSKTTPSEELDKESGKGVGEGTCKTAASLGQDGVPAEVNKTPATPEPTKIPESTGTKVSLQQEVPLSSNKEKKPASSPETPNRRKMAANLTMDHGPEPGIKTTATANNKEQAPRKEEKADKAKKQEMSPGSWCQTQVPEAVAEKSVVAGPLAEVGPKTRDQGVGRSDDALVQGTQVQSSYKGMGTSSLGRHKPVYSQELGIGASGYASPYCSPYSVGRGGVYHTLDHRGGAGADWQMDSVIEQIEKQMAAVLEKIEGDMPSLLEQISDCPETLSRAKSAQSSPSVHARSYHHSTPPPLPTTPRPPLPNLPHLTIPPPSYPPPAPPAHGQAHTQPVTEQDDKDGQRGTMRSGQSPHGGSSGRGL